MAKVGLYYRDNFIGNLSHEVFENLPTIVLNLAGCFQRGKEFTN